MFNPTHQLQGWGLTSCPNADRNPRCFPNRAPQVLQEIQLPVPPRDVCSKAIRNLVAGLAGNITEEELKEVDLFYDTLFCWGGEEGLSGCMGDSGSPLMATSDRRGRTQYTLAGSVQGGLRGGCGQEGNYGLAWEWARYLDWYTDIVEDAGQGDPVLWCKK